MNPRVQHWMGRLYDRRKGWVDGTTKFARLIEAHLKSNDVVVDLGAGPGGEGPVQFRGRCARVVGVDPDEKIRGNPNVDERVRAVAESLPFRDSTVDLFFSDWVVEHLADPGAVAAEVFRVLRPGGHFLFRTGNVRHYVYGIAARTPHWFHHRFANRVRGLPPETDDPYPTFYGMNTRSRVRRLLGEAGFIEEELVAVESEPSYLVFSLPTFLLGVAYERMVNSTRALGGLRAYFLGCFRKPRSSTHALSAIGAPKFGATAVDGYPPTIHSTAAERT